MWSLHFVSFAHYAHDFREVECSSACSIDLKILCSTMSQERLPSFGVLALEDKLSRI